MGAPAISEAAWGNVRVSPPPSSPSPARPPCGTRSSPTPWPAVDRGRIPPPLHPLLRQRRRDSSPLPLLLLPPLSFSLHVKRWRGWNRKRLFLWRRRAVRWRRSISRHPKPLEAGLPPSGGSRSEDSLKAIKEKLQESEPQGQEPGPTTEVLFLCSYEGCGKPFVDPMAVKKHSLVHGEKQFVCHYEGCGKRFLDNSKLKRHFLTHTGERAFTCTYEGCGKAFSLDFNLRAHMRTHSKENYHVCPHEDCGKRYTHLYKLQAHIKARHERNTIRHAKKDNLPEEKVNVTLKLAAVLHSDRPYECPYEGCVKSYIHEYKLKLHSRKEHPGHDSEGNGKITAIEHDKNDASKQDAYSGMSTLSKNLKRSKPTVQSTNLQPLKFARKASSTSPCLEVARKKCDAVKQVYAEDSEETEDCTTVEEDGSMCLVTDGDNEETQDED